MTAVLKINPREPDPGAIARAATFIARGGCVVFPTRCLYGLAADALQARAVERVFAIKERPDRSPLLVLIDHPSRVDAIAQSVPDTARQLMTRFWPGNLTVIVPARPHLPPALTAGTQTIGIRQAGHPVAAALVRSVGGPITGTSANLSGGPGCRDIQSLDPQVANRVDLILDCGPLAGGQGSTVIDTTQAPIVVLREGSIPAKELFPTR